MAAPQIGRESLPDGRAHVQSRLGPAVVMAAALLGALFAFAIPPLQIPDEHGHFVRAYQISRGDWRGDPAPALPQPMLAFLLRYGECIDCEGKLAPSQVWKDVIARGQAAATDESRFVGDHRHRFTTWSILASSLYCPVVYLPAAAGIAGARAAGLSPAAMLYIARLFNVAALTLALWIAFRVAPEARALLAAIALMPMTLHQAGGISADLVTIAMAFVGFALIIRARSAAADRRILVSAALIFPLWILCKTSVWALPLLLFIPQRHFGSRWRRALFVAGVAFAAIAGLLLWQHAIHDNVQLFRADRLARGMEVTGNIAFLTAHPLRFIGMLLAYMAAHFGEHTAQFIGAFGWGQITLSPVVCAGYFGLIVLAATFEPPSRRISAPERIGLASLFAATFAAAYVVLFASDGVLLPRGADPRSFDFPYSAGVQGRYFIPFCLAGFLALRQSRFNMPSSRVLMIVSSASIGLDLLVLVLICTHYYA